MTVRRHILSLLLGFILLWPVASALAQDAATPAPAAVAPSAEELEALIETLDDPAAREKLASQLRALQVAQQDEAPTETLGSRTLDFLSERVTVLSGQIVSVGSAFLDAPQAVRWFKRQLSDHMIRERWLRLAVELSVVLAAGFAANSVVTWLLFKPRTSLNRRAPSSAFMRIPLLVLRTVIDLVPIIAFAFAGFGVLSLTLPPREIKLAALTVINSTIIVHIIIALTRFALSPTSQNLRLLPISNETANYALIWVRRIAYTAVYGYFIGEAGLLLGLPKVSHAAFLKVVGFVVTGMLAVLILQNRSEVGKWLRGTAVPVVPGTSVDDSLPTSAQMPVTRSMVLMTLRQRLAEVWHILAIAYVVVIYGIWALDVDGGFLFMVRATAITLAVLIVARLLIRGLQAGLRRIFSISPELRTQYPNLELRANLYLPLMDKANKVLVWFIATLAILSAWGVNSLGWLETPLGQRVLSGALSIAVVVVIALMAWEMVSRVTERYLNALQPDGQKVERSARARTLLPLLRNVLLVFLLTMVTLVVLSELGLNIAPLLAGAGVIGLAIGFGSQTLVKDVITGLFYLFEDTISVGDVVDVGGGHSGLVEAISIRTMKLRDFSGAVHTIPFSEVRSVINMTKDFSCAVFDVGVAYKEDVERVMDVMRQIGAELQKDPEHSWKILEPLEISGLDRFADSAIMIKARFKTRPTKQWDVTRAYNLRLKRRFDELGIEIPYPSRTLVLSNPPGPDLGKPIGGSASLS